LIAARGRDTGVAMLRISILACTLGLLGATANARVAEESSSDDSAPFASGANKGPAPFASSPSSGFAAVGQWVLTMRTTGDDGYFFFHKPSQGDWEISIHPAIDYFITSSVSVGGVVGYQHSSAATGTTNLDLGARAGFNININDNLGLWPAAGVSGHVASANHDSNTSTALQIFAPFLYHLVPHLFVGAGPSFSWQLSGGDGKVYGIDFVLGGWL
jgi:hypothetical protein